MKNITVQSFKHLPSQRPTEIKPVASHFTRVASHFTYVTSYFTHVASLFTHVASHTHGPIYMHWGKPTCSSGMPDAKNAAFVH